MSPPRRTTLHLVEDHEPSPPPRDFLWESDLGAAAFLICRGFVLTAERVQGRRVYFRLQGDLTDLARAIEDYEAGGEVSAKAFVDQMKSLKHRAFRVMDEEMSR